MTASEAKELVLKHYPGAVCGHYEDFGQIPKTFAIGAPVQIPNGDVDFNVISPVCPSEDSAWIFAAQRIKTNN